MIDTRGDDRQGAELAAAVRAVSGAAAAGGDHARTLRPLLRDVGVPRRAGTPRPAARRCCRSPRQRSARGVGPALPGLRAPRTRWRALSCRCAFPTGRSVLA
ncbi:hypothetical protein HBB16_04175 [Pseudonocardia sp. MCCB 268]|nr:hypothetical protein [Pseudonocardia cytotoxica]